MVSRTASSPLSPPQFLKLSAFTTKLLSSPERIVNLASKLCENSQNTTCAGCFWLCEIRKGARKQRRTSKLRLDARSKFGNSTKSLTSIVAFGTRAQSLDRLRSRYCLIKRGHQESRLHHVSNRPRVCN